jgi:glycosyltransferase involved in cell wall biosynthesis
LTKFPAYRQAGRHQAPNNIQNPMTEIRSFDIRKFEFIWSLGFGYWNFIIPRDSLLNICIITSSFPSHPNDVVQAPFLIDFIKGLKKRGHQVFLFTPDRKEVKDNVLEGIQIEWFPWLASKKPLVQLNPLNPLDGLRIGNLVYKGRKAILPFVKKNKIDACLALWVLPSGYFANYVHQATRVPYSVWALGSDIYRYGRNPFLYPTMKRIILKARGVFADGFDLTKRVEERFGRKCYFLATTRTIRLEPYEPTKPNKSTKPNEPERPYHFLFVGRLEKVKGIDLLLQSMAMLSEEALNVHLTIVGKGSLEEWVRSFIHRKRLEEWVTLKGNVDDQGLASLYTSSHCVVIPSRSESIPLVFSEALNFNKDLIVTNVGDMGMLGRQYEVAWVVPSEDPEALKKMMKKRAELQGHGQNGNPPMIGGSEKRAELKRLFDIETSVERFLADYV